MLVGWVVVRLAVCWPVSWDVVVVVDIGTWNLLGECVEGPAAQTGGGTGLEIPLAGDAFRAIGSPISQRGDHGAACHEEPESEGENLGQAAGFYRDEGWGREGYPIGR